jgi:quercetin dioxygenase-like cupin family protein
MKRQHPLLPDFAREALGERPGVAADSMPADPLLLDALASAGAAWSRTSARPRGADALRARLLDQVRRVPLRYAPLYGRLTHLFDLDEPALVAVLEASQDQAAWEPFAPGVLAFHLAPGPRYAGADAGLIRIKAGLAFPMHEHLGDESVLLLEGGYREGSTGRIYQAGDFHGMKAGSRHSYDVLPDSPLVFAVLLYGGIAFDK